MHADRNIVIIGALRDDFRLSFFNAALMTDPQKVLEKRGENTRHPDMIRFTEVSQVLQNKSTIVSYLKEAMAYAEAGIKPSREDYEIELPAEMIDALDADPELAEAFHKLTPGRKKSYAINLNAAKKPETRVSRIEKFRKKIIAGKGATEW
jgi:uncharacterized protein YdeI (YjbR/CyaY-like superfamily)